MSDPTLAGRLAHLELPTLVLWGDSDQPTTAHRSGCKALIAGPPRSLV